MMLMQVTCPHCGARYQFERSLIPPGGYDAQCANCSGIFVVAPDAREPAIALPSMSMIDTWLAPPAQAPKSARPAATVADIPAPKAAPGTNAAPTQAQPRPAAPQVVSPRGGPAVSVAPGGTPALQFTISCPSCESVYAFAVNELPPSGVDAPCSNCGTAYHLNRVGDPAAVIETLRPLQPTVLAQPKHDDSSIGMALAPDLHSNEDTTPDGDMIRSMAEPTFIERSFRELPASGPRSGRRLEEPQFGDSFAATHLAADPFLAAEPVTTAPLRSELAHTELWPNQRKPTVLEHEESTAVSAKPVDAEIVAEMRDTPLRLASGAKEPDRITTPKLPSEPSDIELLPSITNNEPVLGDIGATATADEPVPSRAIVPMAVNERSRAGAASWGPTIGDPQAVMQSRVRKAGDAGSRSSDSRERGKSRRPPFDHDDVARMRGGSGFIIGDASEFDDREEQALKTRLLLRNIGLIVVGLAVAGALAIFVVVPAITGRTAAQILRIGQTDDPRLLELMTNARASLWPDTDAKYRDAAKAASDALDLDPANPEARSLYGLAAVFRGIDVRAAAQDLVSQGEIVQSSQMLATASAELAHARRVLSRKNDETSELMFAAGIYYALDEDQRGHARDAFRHGMELSSLAENGPPPTPFAAYLDALLKNLDGDNAGARASLERAVKLEPGWQRPRFELARLDAASGENTAARSMLQDVLSRDREHAKAKALLAILPESEAIPHVTPKTVVVPTQAEPTQVLPSATPESLKEPERRVDTLVPKPAIPDVVPHPLPQTAPPRSPDTTPRPSETPSPRNDVVPTPNTPKTDAPPSPRPSPEPAAPEAGDSDMQTPPDAPNIVRGAPPPFAPSEQGRDDGHAKPPTDEAPPDAPKNDESSTN